MKKLLLLFCVLVVLLALLSVPVLAQDNITVTLNGEKLEFDVQPALMNDRTMVPMRAIFEALDTTVYYTDYTETVSAYNPTAGTIVLPIGADTATVNGKAVELDQPAVLKDSRTLVPIRFVAESLGCKVDWVDATQTVVITSDLESFDKTSRYYGISEVFDIGEWVVEGQNALKGKTTTPDGVSLDLEQSTGDARLNIDIAVAGKYKVWALSRDYATNQPGSRYFNIAIDGVRSPNRFGTHGKDGYQWTEVGVYDFTEGLHEVRLQDTSCFYARWGGLFVTKDLNFKPSAVESEYLKYHLPSDKAGAVIPASYPEWATADMQATATETIENNKIKIVFYQGVTNRGGLVQNEIYLKQNGAWTLVKARSEDLGVLAMRNNDGFISTLRPPVANLSDTPWENHPANIDTYIGEYSVGGVSDFYKMGAPEWLIPNGMTRIDDKTIQLTMTSENVDGTLTYTFDDLSFEPKVTFNATIKKDGGYSFAHFTGDAFKDGEFDRVTAPLMYTKDFVPEDNRVLAEYMMFTPMVTFTFGEGENAISKGIVVDPTSVRQDVATPGRSEYGVMFRAPNGKVRGQILAPLFGSETSSFKEGMPYTFSYRLLYNDADWYENYTHVAQDIYNCVDLRTNYYASLNEAIYNTTDLMMDDTYGGWDDKDMGFYNMEAKRVTTISNGVELMQRYMLTENEEILTERAVPALAFMLTRGGMHFKRVDGGNSYTPQAPVTLSGINNGFGPSTYLTLYRMSQGRMPFLMNHAVSKLGAAGDAGNVAGYAAMNALMGNDAYKAEVIEAADKYLKQLEEGSTYYSKPYGGFVYTNDVPMMQAYLTAYEVTRDQKYLDGAKEVGELIMAALWTTGYQNDYASTDYTVTPEKVYSRGMANDVVGGWYYHKEDTQWRVGNPYGVVSPVYVEPYTQNLIKEETGPGWLPARTGMSTEHTMTPSNGNAITMNMWAGTGLRVGNYTGDAFITTQARNAMIGRFANYSGYYYERYLLHDKQERYPYDGPDTNLIYWHHIPVFLGLLEDFLINDIWDKSDGNVEFPTAVNQGYAYFVSNQYGFDSGKFYDQDDMWIWLDRGIVEPDSVEIDYLPAKKDGVLGIAFVNEGAQEKTTTITLGEKVPNGATLTTTATLYDKAGNKSTVEIVNGKFTLTIPAKGIQSVVFNADVKKPVFAQDYTPSLELGETVANFAGGKAYLMQFNADNYYAYMYTNLMAVDAESVTFTYTHNGKTESKTINEYPFETIIKVPATSDFEFEVHAVLADGTQKKLGSGTLKPADLANAKPFVKGDKAIAEQLVSALDPFENFDVKLNGAGTDSVLRLVCDASNAPFELKPGVFAGLKIKGVLEEKATGKKVLLESEIVGNEVRDNGVVVLRVNPTSAVPFDDYNGMVVYGKPLTIISPDKDFTSVKIANEEQYRNGVMAESGKIERPDSTGKTEQPAMAEFEPFQVKYNQQGASGNQMRFVAPKNQFPFALEENCLKGLQLTITAKEAATGLESTFTVTVSGNEMRDTTTVITYIAPDAMPATDYDNDKAKTHTFTLILSMPNADVSGVDVEKPETPAPPAQSEEKAETPASYDQFVVKAITCGALETGYRMVVAKESFPFAVSTDSLKGAKVKVISEIPAINKKIEVETTVSGLEMRADGKVTVVIPWGDWGQLKDVGKDFNKSSAEITFLKK